MILDATNLTEFWHTAKIHNPFTVGRGVFPPCPLPGACVFVLLKGMVTYMLEKSEKRKLT